MVGFVEKVQALEDLADVVESRQVNFRGVRELLGRGVEDGSLEINATIEKLLREFYEQSNPTYMAERLRAVYRN